MLVLPAELTHRHATACSSMLLQALRKDTGHSLVADATTLTLFDSSALAVLMECRREALGLRKSFSVRGLPPRLRELAVLYGVAELLPEAA